MGETKLADRAIRVEESIVDDDGISCGLHTPQSRSLGLNLGVLLFTEVLVELLNFLDESLIVDDLTLHLLLDPLFVLVRWIKDARLFGALPRVARPVA